MGKKYSKFLSGRTKVVHWEAIINMVDISHTPTIIDNDPNAPRTQTSIAKVIFAAFAHTVHTLILNEGHLPRI